MGMGGNWNVESHSRTSLAGILFRASRCIVNKPRSCLVTENVTMTTVQLK